MSATASAVALDQLERMLLRAGGRTAAQRQEELALIGRARADLGTVQGKLGLLQDAVDQRDRQNAHLQDLLSQATDGRREAEQGAVQLRKLLDDQRGQVAEAEAQAARLAELEAEVARLEAGGRRKMPPPPPCRIEWCEAPSVRKRDLCPDHLHRQQRFGDPCLLRLPGAVGRLLQETGAGTFVLAPEAAEVTAKAAKPKAARWQPCGIAWCTKLGKGRYCDAHAFRARKYGDAAVKRYRLVPGGPLVLVRETGIDALTGELQFEEVAQ